MLFRYWKDGRPYDEPTYLQALAKCNLPLPSSTVTFKVGWKSVDGFKRRSIENLDGTTQMATPTCLSL
jgi:hypothetical protein